MALTNQEIETELQKCKDSPYYFYTTYWLINGKPATTPLSEEEFNRLYYLNIHTKSHRRCR